MSHRSTFGFSVSLVAILAVGCGSNPPPAKPNANPTPSSTKPSPDKPAHTAHGAGPHGATITAWGGGDDHRRTRGHAVFGRLQGGARQVLEASQSSAGDEKWHGG